MMEKVSGPKKMLHVIIGTPDGDNCPICRAHAQAAGSPVMGGEHGPIRVQEIPLSEMLRCPCPLCTQARQEALGA
jgi:hypothetical protein